MKTLRYILPLRHSSRCFGWIRHTLPAALIIGSAILFPSPDAFAQEETDPPLQVLVKEIKTPDQLSDEISGKLTNLNERVYQLSLNATNAVDNLFTKNQKKHMKNQYDRNKNSNAKLAKEKAFKNMGKKDKFKEKKKDTDAVLATDDAAQADDSEYDPDDLADLSQMLTDVDVLVGDTEEALEDLQKVKEQKELAMQLLAEGMDPEMIESELRKRHPVYDDLEGLLDGSHHDHAFYVAIKAAKLASVGFSMAYDINDSVCNQDTAGWNASAAGAIFASIAGVMELVAEGLEINMYVSDGDQSRKMIRCIAQIGTEHAEMINELATVTSGVATITEDAGELSESVDQLHTKVDRLDYRMTMLSNDVAAINRRLDSMDQMLVARLNYIEQLLCTPQGSRPGFPIKSKTEAVSVGTVATSGVSSTASGSQMTAMDSWRYTYFGTVTNTAPLGDLDDYEGDGSVNLLEFGLATDPTVSNTVPVQYAVADAVIEYTYQRNKAALDELDFEVCWSDDLTNKKWSSTGVTESIIEDNGEIEIVLATVPKGTSDYRFITLFVSRK